MIWVDLGWLRATWCGRFGTIFGLRFWQFMVAGLGVGFWLFAVANLVSEGW